MQRSAFEKNRSAGIDRLVAVERKLGSASDQAGDGPTLVEVVCVGSLVAAEVEVAADVEVRGVVQLLYAHFATESHCVPALDESCNVTEVL